MTDAGIIQDVVSAAVTYRVPDEYMLGLVTFSFVITAIIAGIEAKVAYNDMLKDKGLTRAECPFGADYVLAVVVTGVLGAIVSYLAAGIVLGLMGHQDAPMMVYYAVAFFAAVIVGRFGWGFLVKFPDIIRDRLKISDSSADD